jgi:hypothetical protein
VVWGSNKVDPVRGDGSSNASFDNLILKVSTDSDDNVVEVSGFYVVQYDIIQAVYNSWAGGTLSFTGSSSSGEIDITGTQSVVDGACLAPLPFFNGEDCSYNESNPTTFGTHWLGPVATGGYYQVGQSPFALGSTSDTPQIGDNKYAVPLLPGSFIRIEDNGTACDTDDQISGSISLGAATRAFAGGPGTWGEETWGDGDIVFPIPATQVDAATPNGAGGCDYEIASAGFPPLLQSTKGGTYIFDTDIVESPPGPAPEDSWVASSPVGVACVTEGNCGVSVAVTVGPGWSCTENFAGACDMGPDGGSHFGGTRGTLENFLIAVSTNGNGEITAGTIFANNESKVFNVPPDPYNSWDGPMLNFTGTSVSGCTMVSAIDDSFTFINDGAPRDFDVLVNDECKDDPPISIVSLPGDLIPDQGGSAITDGERVTYTPPGGFAGPESFTYTAQDAGLAGGQEPPAVDQDTATVTVTLIEDLIPEAVDDEAEILQDQTVFIDVLANDILGNPDNVVSIETAPDNGSAFVQANNTIRYFPNFMFFGPDSFEYRLTDANGDTDVATVNVGVFFVSGRVPIDIMPGHEINNINLQAGGRIQVAILSVGEFFDAPATVDPFSLKFGPREANIIGTPQVRDIDRDGDDDLLVKFLIEQTGIPCGVTRTQLIGGTFTGGFIFGDDSVNTFQCRRRPISY